MALNRLRQSLQRKWCGGIDNPVHAAAVRANGLALPSDGLQPCVAGILIGEHPAKLGYADGSGNALAAVYGVAVLIVLDDGRLIEAIGQCHHQCLVPTVNRG